MTNKITREFLIKKLALQFNITQNRAKILINEIIDFMNHSFENGHSVQVMNFGAFKKVKLKKREGRNPKNPSSNFTIPERHTIKFIPSSIFRKEMRENSVP